jgi:TRAP-type transport system periplasmic protein
MAKRLIAAALVAAAASLPAIAQAAEPITLRFGFPAPPQSKVNVWGSGPWSQDVMKAAGGTIDIKLFPGNSIVSVQTTYDRTVAGVSDITFGIFGPLQGVFQRVNVTELPFEADNDTEASIALSRLWEQNLLDKAFDRVKVLSLFTFPAPVINANKPIATAEDVKGLKFAVAGRVLAELITALGGSPVTLGPPEFYQAAQRGVVDGVFVGWSAVTTFKIDEVTKYHTNTSAGYAPAFMTMNKQAFARLPQKAKDAIDRYSGAPYFKRMGEVTDRMDKVGEKLTGAKKGHTITTISAAEKARWKKLAAPIFASWEKRTPDGEKVLAAFRKALDDIRAGK